MLTCAHRQDKASAIQSTSFSSLFFSYLLVATVGWAATWNFNFQYLGLVNHALITPWLRLGLRTCQAPITLLLPALS